MRRCKQRWSCNGTLRGVVFPYPVVFPRQEHAMPLVFGCIAPHGGVIPGLPGAEGCAATTAAMQEMGQRLELTQPEIIVVVTPHGIRVDGALAISLSERAAGSLDEPLALEGEIKPVHI